MGGQVCSLDGSILWLWMWIVMKNKAFMESTASGIYDMQNDHIALFNFSWFGEIWKKIVNHSDRFIFRIITGELTVIRDSTPKDLPGIIQTP